MGSTWGYIVDVYDDIVQAMENIVNDIDESLGDMWDDLLAGDIEGLLNDIAQLSTDLAVDIIYGANNVVVGVTKVIVSAYEETLYLAELAINELSFLACDQGTPNPRNICSLSDAQKKTINGFCSEYNPIDTSYNLPCKNMCNLMGSEWGYSDRGGSCAYSSCIDTNRMNGGCCGICCPVITGGECVCQRKGFFGDPLACCFKDLKCHVADVNDQDEIAYNPYCFETTDQTRTCSTYNRDQGASPCRDNLESYCLGEDLPSDSREFYDRWLGDVDYNGTIYNKPCQRALYRNVFANNADGDKTVCALSDFNNTNNMETIINQLNTNYSPDPNGLDWGKRLINNLMGRYTMLGGTLSGREDTEGDTRMNNMFLNICSDTPGLCADMLNNYCVNVTNDSLERDATLLPFCGCYMPPEQYSKYANYQLQRQCTPTCNANGVVPIVGNDGYTPEKCSQSFCIMDDISINIINSDSTDVTFSQLCGSCSDGNTICNCTISGFTLNEIDSTLGNNTVSQNCGTSACYAELYDDQGNLTTVQVPCNGSTSDAVIPDDENDNQSTSYTAIFIGFIILILIIIVIWNIILSGIKI